MADNDELTAEAPQPEPPAEAAPAATEIPETEDIEALKKALEEAREEAQRNFANWQRAAADYINFKRRTEQERNEYSRNARAMLILNLLPVLDDLERALENVDTKLAGLTWVEGIRLIWRKLVATLEAQGLREIKALGEPFDPNLHEAVLQGPGPEGQVIGVLQKGYMLQDRLVRPAMVRVGTGEPESADADQTPPAGSNSAPASE